MSSLCWNARLFYANLQKQMSSRHCCWSPDVHLRYLGLFSEHHISERERARDGDGLQRCVALYGRTSGQLLNCRVPRMQPTAKPPNFVHVTLTWLSRQPIVRGARAGIPSHMPVLHQRMEFSLTWDGFGKEVMSKMCRNCICLSLSPFHLVVENVTSDKSPRQRRQQQLFAIDPLTKGC